MAVSAELRRDRRYVAGEEKGSESEAFSANLGEQGALVTDGVTEVPGGATAGGGDLCGGGPEHAGFGSVC